MDALEVFGDRIEWHTMGEGFTWETQDKDRDIAAAQRAWARDVDLMANPDVSLVKVLSTLLVYASVNATMPPFDNPDARQALRYAINYDNIVTLLGGNGELVQEIIPIGFAGHLGNNPFTQDLEKAKELFANAGVTEGAVIPFTVATGTGPGGVDWATIAASIQADLAQIGICLLYTSPSPRDRTRSRMPSSA
mgnify:CR=1 FL=1